jgi:hypothetical protein
VTFKHTIDHCIVEDDGGELMILLRNSVIENIQKKSTKNSNVLRTNWPKFSLTAEFIIPVTVNIVGKISLHII